MSARHVIVCDTCGFDLTEIGNDRRTRLMLCVESVQPMNPPGVGRMNATVHFCNSTCLNTWMAEKNL